jgi:hypothetical protein
MGVKTSFEYGEALSKSCGATHLLRETGDYTLYKDEAMYTRLHTVSKLHYYVFIITISTLAIFLTSIPINDTTTTNYQKVAIMILWAIPLAMIGAFGKLTNDTMNTLDKISKTNNQLITPPPVVLISIPYIAAAACMIYLYWNNEEIRTDIEKTCLFMFVILILLVWQATFYPTLARIMNAVYDYGTNAMTLDKELTNKKSSSSVYDSYFRNNTDPRLKEKDRELFGLLSSNTKIVADSSTTTTVTIESLRNSMPVSGSAVSTYTKVVDSGIKDAVYTNYMFTKTVMYLLILIALYIPFSFAKRLDKTSTYHAMGMIMIAIILMCIVSITYRKV